MSVADAFYDMMSGTGGFIAYWSILALIALAETLGPARPSSIAGRMKVNFGLGLVGAAVMLVPAASAVALSEWARHNNVGLFNQIAVPGWTGVIVAILALDLARYAFHRASHRWAPLWRLHQVHHGDPAIDLSTLFRQHPLSVALITATDAVTIVVFGFDPLGVMAFTAASLLVMPLAHAQLPPSPRLSRAFATILVTPRFHHRHHSARREQTDSNYGELLTLWDRALGTVSPDEDVARYGLGDAADRDAGSLRRQLLLPFVREKEPGDPPQTVVAASFRT